MNKKQNTVNVQKSTSTRLQLIKYHNKFKSADELLNYLMDLYEQDE